MQPSLSVSLRIRGRRVVVIGGGPEAEERVVRLFEAQAQPVVVVAPALTEALERWRAAGRLEHRPRPVESGDLDGAFLALLCDSRDEKLAERLYCEADARGILFYAQDQPDWSHLAMPALVRRGSLRLAISTSDASPALAGRLRGELERIFDEPFVRYLAWLDDLRERLREEEPDADRRATRLREAVEGFSMNAVLHYPTAWPGR